MAVKLRDQAATQSGQSPSPRRSVDLREQRVEAHADGAWVPVSSRQQLEQLERAHGRVPLRIHHSDGTHTDAVSATARTTKLPGAAKTGRRHTLPAPTVLADSPAGDAVTWIGDVVSSAGGRALVVGGAVRDALLGVTGVKDLDVEVFGVDPGDLVGLLGGRYQVDQTGKAFAVYKLAGLDVDVSLPRTERSTGDGHRAFDVTPDPHLDPRVAASRRDFTINAISWDPLTGEIVDPLGGVEDLRKGVLRATGANFDEDPLRVLRGMQFASRFGFDVDPGTIRRCRQLLPQAHTLPRERIWAEFEKHLVRGREPGRGMRFLRASGWDQLWPTIGDLDDGVYETTAAALDRWATAKPSRPDDIVITGLAVTTHRCDAAAARAFVGSITTMTTLAGPVAQLVDELRNLDRAGISDAAIRHLAARVKRIDRLVTVARALGGNIAEEAAELAATATRLGVLTAPPAALISGKDLLDAGARTGPAIGAALAAAYTAQLDGTVTTPAAALEVAMDALGAAR